MQTVEERCKSFDQLKELGNGRRLIIDHTLGGEVIIGIYADPFSGPVKVGSGATMEEAIANALNEIR
jgi:hypothetical protein